MQHHINSPSFNDIHKLQRDVQTKIIDAFAAKYGINPEEARQTIVDANIIMEYLPETKRKNVDHNCCELVDAILLAIYGGLIHSPKVPTFANVSELTQEWIETKCIPHCILVNFDDTVEYTNDMKGKSKVVDSRIKSFIEHCNKIISTGMKCIYIAGKNTWDVVTKLNTHLDAKQTKGDIYIEYNDGDTVAVSCKQSENAPKSNYSVNLMVSKETATKLDDIKKAYLEVNGHPSYSKTSRSQVNKLFYDKNNPYWRGLRDAIINWFNTIIILIHRPAILVNVTCKNTFRANFTKCLMNPADATKQIYKCSVLLNGISLCLITRVFLFA